MSSHVKIGGVWREVTTVHAKIAGAWRQVTEGWVKVSGVWKQVYTALQAILDDTYYYSAATSSGVPETAFVSPYVTATGTGPFTYLWHVTGGYSNILGATTANLTIRLTGTFVSASGNVYCTVTDSLGNSVDTALATWELEVSPL